MPSSDPDRHCHKHMDPKLPIPGLRLISNRMSLCHDALAG